MWSKMGQIYDLRSSKDVKNVCKLNKGRQFRGHYELQTEGAHVPQVEKYN